MRQPKGQKHKCAPKEYRKTSNMTGDYDLDSAIMRNSNKDMATRIQTHVVKDDVYGHRTGYKQGGDS